MNAKQLLSMCESPFFVVPNPYARLANWSCHCLLNAHSASQSIINVTWKYSVESCPFVDRSSLPVDLKNRFAEMLLCRLASTICFSPLTQDIAANSYMSSARAFTHPVRPGFSIGSQYFDELNDYQLAERFLREID
jgi:hypothetical protein